MLRGRLAGWSVAGVVFGTVDASAVRGLWGALTDARHLPTWAVAPLCTLYVLVTVALFMAGYRLDRRYRRDAP